MRLISVDLPSAVASSFFRPRGEAMADRLCSARPKSSTSFPPPPNRISSDEVTAGVAMANCRGELETRIKKACLR